MFSECLKALGHLEVAVKSYSKVVEMAPLHLDARLALSTLQQRLGRPNMALEALEPMYDTETLAQDASAAQQVCVCIQRQFFVSTECEFLGVCVCCRS